MIMINGNMLHYIPNIRGQAKIIQNSKVMLLHRCKNVVLCLVNLAVISNTIRVWNTE